MRVIFLCCAWAVFHFSPLARSESAARRLLSIERDGAEIRLRWNGEIGKSYRIDASDSLAGWEPLVTWNQAGPTEQWTHLINPSWRWRFFRTVEIQAERVTVSNFRLIDQANRSNELYYQSTRRAVVLTFLDLACPSAPRVVDAIARMRDRHNGSGVLFWFIDTTGRSERSELSSRVAALGISDLPVLHDRGQLVTGAYGVRTVPEAWIIDPAGWQLVYRGAVASEGTVASAASEYAADALERFLSNQELRFTRTPGGPCETGMVSEPAPDYATEIAPLLKAKCVSCHSSGNIAPWEMNSHAKVQSYALSIREEILAGRMPPWHADPQFGQFSNESGLNPEEASKLIRWVEAGAPRGAGADPLASVDTGAGYPFAWPAELGNPDVILSVPRQSIRATGEEPYHYVSVPTGLTEDVWVRAAVILPGNVAALHHCLVYFGGNSLLRGLDGFFAGYVPGSAATEYPADTGKFLPKGTVLQFQLHYSTTGKTETDQTRIGLYLHREKPKFELQTRSAFSVFFTIPPRHADFPATGQYRFDQDVWLYEMSPHMHYRGSRFRFEALYPDGQREILLNVPKYEFDWQRAYRLAQPKRLPAGTTLYCFGAWDNSAQNPKNPNPDIAVRFGEQSDDEMFIGYFNFAVAQ